jgi:hypothetical protein
MNTVCRAVENRNPATKSLKMWKILLDATGKFSVIFCHLVVQIKEGYSSCSGKTQGCADNCLGTGFGIGPSN